MKEEPKIIEGFVIKFLDRQNFQIQLGEHWIAVEYNPKVNAYTIKGGVFESRGVPDYAAVVNPNDRNFVERAIGGVARKQQVRDYMVLYEP